MARRLIECVPNFSEGRDRDVVDAIVNAIGGTPGVFLLGQEADADHNRSVVTFAGEPQPVAAAALRGIAEAVRRIDLSSHEGVHPRIGAADVVPLVPVEGVTLEECVHLAHELGEEVWRMLKVPVYFYEAAARARDRTRLENVRRGGLAWLREHATERTPDVGGPGLHPTAGAVIIGARKFLIAFNINLTTGDVEIARRIARAVRESSGGLPAVKAIGVPLESLGLAQVSMNLTDFERTGMGQAFDAVHALAARHGVGIATSEIIGLVPRRALNAAAATLLRCKNYSPDRVLEDRIEAVGQALLPAAGSQPPSDLTIHSAEDPTLADLLRNISNPASPMGGGSASALAGSLSAALGDMVAQIAKTDSGRFLEHREFFTQAAARDAEAFHAVLVAHKSAAEEEALQAALCSAALVPTEISERARELDRDLLRLKDLAPAKVQSDLTAALALARAARAGSMAAARSNLPSISSDVFRQDIEERLDRKLPH